MALSSSNRNSARARASSVLPTPVGPRKMNEPMGRFGSFRPERARTTASATASTASSWPITRWCSSSPRCSSFCTSPSSSFETGMCVQRLTTSAMSSSSTSSLMSRCGALASRSSVSSSALSWRSSSGKLAVFQLGGLVEVVLALGLLDLAAWSARSARGCWRSCWTLSFSACHWALRASASAFRSASSFSNLCQPFARGGVLLLLQGFALDLQLHDAAG